jgi:predicted RNA-binding protein (virulence factor B family)
MVKAGVFNTLTISRITGIGAYLDDGGDGLLLPKRFLPRNVKPGDSITVFVYHDSENRLIATTQQPIAIVGDIALMHCVSVTSLGAFLDWGLMKDLFVPRSKQISGMRKEGDYLVKLYIDEQTGRVAATEKIESLLSNDPITVKEKEIVQLLIYRKSDIGYVTIINNLHTGVLHFNEVYRNLQIGDKLEGFIKEIKQPGNKIDVALGKPGYQRVEDETTKLLDLLHKSNGYLPFNDKSSPEDIYRVFGMSKKTFKMTTGRLYKEKKIEFTEGGIKLLA